SGARSTIGIVRTCGRDVPDALLLLFELADTKDERFQAAAARWHARFVLEAGLPLREAESLMALLGQLRGADRLVARRQRLRVVGRAGLATTEIRASASYAPVVQRPFALAALPACSRRASPGPGRARPIPGASSLTRLCYASLSRRFSWRPSRVK